MSSNLSSKKIYKLILSMDAKLNRIENQFDNIQRKISYRKCKYEGSFTRVIYSLKNKLNAHQEKLTDLKDAVSELVDSEEDFPLSVKVFSHFSGYYDDTISDMEEMTEIYSSNIEVFERRIFNLLNRAESLKLIIKKYDNGNNRYTDDDYSSSEFDYDFGLEKDTSSSSEEEDYDYDDYE